VPGGLLEPASTAEFFGITDSAASREIMPRPFASLSGDVPNFARVDLAISDDLICERFLGILICSIWIEESGLAFHSGRALSCIMGEAKRVLATGDAIDACAMETLVGLLLGYLRSSFCPDDFHSRLLSEFGKFL